MEKVKLPKEVAEAIDRSKHKGMAAIMGYIARFHNIEAMQTTSDLFIIANYYKENPYIIACALVNGYEVEQTPEDIVRGMYLIATDIERNAIVSTLNAVGVSVKGVNT